MIAKELLDWFPDGKILDQPGDKEGYLSLPLSNYQWLLLEEASLSEREKQLVALLTKQEQTISLNPWYTYLIEGKGQAPQNFKKVAACLLSPFLFPTRKSIFLARYDANPFSKLPDYDSGGIPRLHFCSSTGQVHIRSLNPDRYLGSCRI